VGSVGTLDRRAPEARGSNADVGTSAPGSVGVEWIVTSLFALVGWIVGSGRLSDNSFFWHLRTGEYILDHGIPRGDVFSYTAPGTKWIAQSWLAELTYGAIDRTVGPYGIRVFTGLVAVAISVLVYRLALRLAGGWLRAAGISGAALAGVFTLWSARPLVLGVLFFVVLLWIVEVPDSFVGRHPVVWIPIVLWLWANVHGSFALGLAYLGLHLIGRWIDGAPPVRGRERLLAVGAAVGVVASLVNPYGLSLLTFPIDLLGRGEILSHVIEWQSPDFRARWGLALGLWICVYVAALARGAARVTKCDLIVSVPMLLLALWATRNIAVAPLVGLPVAARAFAKRDAKVGVEFRTPVVVIACGAIAVVIAVLGVSSAAEPAFAFRSYPVSAMRFVERSNLLGKHILTDDADAGYVIERYWPQQRVFMDDRFDMFPTKLIEDYFEVSRGGPEWTQVLDQRDVDVVVWDKDLALASLLDNAGAWERVHTDARYGVWVRASS
jgi:energy-converting hydrogenase Eha subunit A